MIGARGPEPARDSGRGWLVVAAAFTSMFTVFGIAYSFGAFFRPMAREFGAGSGATSLVFGITAFLYFGLGALTGAVADRIGPRRVLMVGAAVLGGGLLLTSVVPALWVGYLTYGVGVGIGTACGYVPMVAAVGGWFDRRRSLAIGVAVTGIGFGTLSVAPLAAALIARYGWRHTYVILGVAGFAVLAACAAAAERPPVPPGAPRPPGRALRTREFGLLYCCGLLTSLALFVAFVHLVPYAAGRGVAPVPAAALIGVIGAGSIVGRLGLGAVADRLGAVRTFQLALGVLGSSYALWLLAPGYAGLVAFAAVLGAGYGGWVALSPSVMAELYGPEGLGGSVGALYTSAALGSLLGPPAAGLLVDATGDYRPAIVAAVVLSVLSLLVVAPLPARRVHSRSESMSVEQEVIDGGS